MRLITFITLLLLLTGLSSFAGTPGENVLRPSRSEKSSACTATPVSAFQSNIYQTADGKVNVILIDGDAEPVSLQIFDSQNHRLFSEEVKENSIRHRFSMQELEPGSYTFTLSKNGECFTKTVTVK